ncbi:MAG: DNA gyrase inhibitor YacG [Desulfuromonadales bacterium]
MKHVKCPQCKQRVVWSGNPHRPFCSERCRLIDLGQWADESYRIAGPRQAPLSEDNVKYLQSKKQDFERS